MGERARFLLRGRNPDVLSCIANLSNDEVFTPPEFANKMLDTLSEAWAESNNGENIWANPDVTFLDPFTKSGVFLREITSRLVEGLEEEIPDLETRVDQILAKQVYGIGITSLTSLLARRSVYCSKWANGEHSIVKSLDSEDGNIWFERLEHTWEGGTEWFYTADAQGNQVKKFTNGRCKYCGAPQLIFDRDEGLDTHAYAFIHADDIKARVSELFGSDMNFDVVVGNPPYQMTGGGGGSNDSSIYHLFAEQALALEPRFLSMVIPSRWMAGGRGLDEFRKKMLTSRHLKELVDWNNSGEAFPGVQIKGGICYFLWENDYQGKCRVTRVSSGEPYRQEPRDLSEFDVFIRDERALSILRKVLPRMKKPVSELVSGDTPFGIATNFQEFTTSRKGGDLELHRIDRGKRTVSYVKRSLIRKNVSAIDKWKVFLPKAYGAGESYPHQILGQLIVSGPGTVSTQTYVMASPFESETEANSFASFYRTRFFRFLVSLRKITQDAPRAVYSWVPQQSWDRVWSDAALSKRYRITPEEVGYIESMIRPIDLSVEVND